MSVRDPLFSGVAIGCIRGPLVSGVAIGTYTVMPTVCPPGSMGVGSCDCSGSEVVRGGVLLYVGLIVFVLFMCTC